MPTYALSWRGRTARVRANVVVTVGRHEACALCVAEGGDASVSRQHVEFRVGARGSLDARDLGSTHGTRLIADDGAVEAVKDAWVCVLDATTTSAAAAASVREVVLGKGGTRVRATRDDDASSAREADDDGSATEPDEDDAPRDRSVIVDDMGELTQARVKRKTREPTMGEAELVYGELVVRDAGEGATTTTTTTTSLQGANFKTFKKQSVAGMKKTAARRAPAEAYASVYEHERPMTDDERARMKNDARADKEAEDLFAMGLPSDAKAKRKAPVARKKK